MTTRTSSAEWKGTLKDGAGTMKLASGAYEGAYTYASRFEEAKGTNPEELIGAAHAGCFSMAFAHGLAQAGFTPRRVHTTAKVSIERVGEGFAITKIRLATEAEVPGIDERAFLALSALFMATTSTELGGLFARHQGHKIAQGYGMFLWASVLLYAATAWRVLAESRPVEAYASESIGPGGAF